MIPTCQKVMKLPLGDEVTTSYSKQRAESEGSAYTGRRVGGIDLHRVQNGRYLSTQEAEWEVKVDTGGKFGGVSLHMGQNRRYRFTQKAESEV